jgi:hypothetical protein
MVVPEDELRLSGESHTSRVPHAANALRSAKPPPAETRLKQPK